MLVTGGIDLDNDTKINEMEITDEYTMADESEPISEIAAKLRKIQDESDHGVVLITQDEDKVIGFVSRNEIIGLIVAGKSLSELATQDVMNKDFMEVSEDDTLGDIIPQISEQYPNSVVVVNSDGRCVGYFSKNDYKDALAGMGVYDKAHKPKSGGDWRTRGIAMSSLGKRSDALKCFERSIKSSTDQEKGWSDLAKRLERINKRKEAIMCMDKVITLNSENEEALTTRGDLYAEEKTKNLAMQSYKMALDINPDNVEALMSMSVEQANIGEIDEAMKCLDRVVTIKGETPEVWFRRGNLYDKAKLYENSLECYNLATKLNSYYEEAWFNKGMVLNQLGKDQDALQCLIKLLQINPANESARQALNSYNEKGALKLS